MTDTTGKGGRWLGLALVAATLAGCAPMGPGGMERGTGSDGGMGMPGGMGAEHRMSGGPAGSATDVQGSEPLPDAREIVVEAGDMFFQPRTISVVAGEAVNLTVTNGGAAFHDLAVPELGFAVEVPSGTTRTGGLVVEEAGQYPFECRVPGHAGAGMTGILVVTDG